MLQEIEPFEDLIKKLARISKLTLSKEEPSKETDIAQISKDFKIFIPKTELGDIEKEIERKKKELEAKNGALVRADEKLKNQKFVSSAPAQVIEGVKKQRDDLHKEVLALKQYLRDIGGE